MTAGIGHNSGRVTEPGTSWRKHAWTRARKDLMPTLPVEIVRLRVKRAAQLGLPYKTYAGIRASSGHDLIGFMFSSNALHILRDGQTMPGHRADKLQGLIDTARIGLAHRPVTPRHLTGQVGIDAGYAAPRFGESWSDTRNRMRDIIGARKQPADRFVMVGDTAFEREWAEAARMAGYLDADQFFERQS